MKRAHQELAAIILVAVAGVLAQDLWPPQWQDVAGHVTWLGAVTAGLIMRMRGDRGALG